MTKSLRRGERSKFLVERPLLLCAGHLLRSLLALGVGLGLDDDVGGAACVVTCTETTCI